jgi:hypothetical protein
MSEAVVSVTQNPRSVGAVLAGFLAVVRMAGRQSCGQAE